MSSPAATDLQRLENETEKNKSAVKQADSRSEAPKKSVTKKEIEQTQKCLENGACIMRALKKNFNERYKQRQKTCKKLKIVNENIVDRLQDKKIARAVSNSISTGGGTAAFIPPAGTIVAGIAKGTSSASQIATDIVKSILDEEDIDEVNESLNMEHFLEAQSGRLVCELDHIYEALETLSIDADRAQVLIITSANYENVQTYSLVQSVLKNTSMANSFFEGPRSGHFVDPVTGTISIGSKAVSGLSMFDKVAVRSGSKRLSGLKVIEEGLDAGLYKGKNGAMLGTKLGNALNGLAIVRDLYQIVALWGSMEHEFVKMMDDLYEDMVSEVDIFKKAAADLNETIRK